ncbi:MAG: hypothetical protein HY741_02655 [Chloroflexi bacterium]|nr:hypothetical protein [Chloroflexota bacterium]
MTAFLSALNAFAIWIYLGGVIAILFGIKMLFDARRAARTTLFTLEQEQASDRAFRAVVVMGLATVIIAAVAGINAFVGPNVPAQESDTLTPTAVPYTPPVILPTPTQLPTLTPLPPTAVPTQKPTGTVQPTPAAPVTGAPQPTAPAAPPTAIPSPTSVLIYLAPALNVPPNGDSIGSNKVRFSWGVDQFGNLAVPALLPPDQFYRLVISFTDKNKNALARIVLCTHENSVDQRTGINVDDYRTQAVDSEFKWNVTIVRASSQQTCEAGEFSPLSPTSQTFTFILP